MSTATNSSSNSTKLPSGKLSSNGKSSLAGVATVLGKVQAFAKKDVNVMNPSKKKKVLCEASTSMSSGGSGGAGVNVNQIPRKKIKVSNAANVSVNPATQSTAPDFYGMTSAKTIDDEMPCCSKSVPAFLSKSPTSPASSTSSTSSNMGQMKITSFMPIKKHSKTKKLKAVAQFQAAKNRIGGKLKKIKVDDPQCSSAPISYESLAAQASPSSISPSSKLLSKKKKLKPLKSLKKRSQKPLLH